MSKYAIIETGSKQYRVEPKTVLEVERFDVPENQKEVTLENVLLVADGENVRIGTPNVQGAKVICEYLGEVRGDKTISFRFRRRKNSRKKIGHRQDYAKLRVKEIIQGK